MKVVEPAKSGCPPPAPGETDGGFSSTSTLVVSEDSTIKSDDFVINEAAEAEDEAEDEQVILTEILMIEKTLHEVEEHFDEIEKSVLTVEKEIEKNEREIQEMEEDINEMENNFQDMIGFEAGGEGVR